MGNNQILNRDPGHCQYTNIHMAKKNTKQQPAMTNVSNSRFCLVLDHHHHHHQFDSVTNWSYIFCIDKANIWSTHKHMCHQNDQKKNVIMNRKYLLNKYQTYRKKFTHTFQDDHYCHLFQFCSTDDDDDDNDQP